MTPSILTLAEASGWLAKCAGDKLGAVICPVHFDVLGPAQIRLLQMAAREGDRLLAVLIRRDETDASRRPDDITQVADRLEMIAALRWVNAALAATPAEIASLLKDHSEARLVYSEADESQIPDLKDVTPHRHAVPSRLIHNPEAGGAGYAFADKPEPLRLAVLGSGKGSNLQWILKAIAAGHLNARVELILSDIPDSGVLRIAREAGIRHLLIDPGAGKARLGEPAVEQIMEALAAARPDLIALAGFMRIVPPSVVEAYQGRILNIHPSLLPRYRGLNAWKQALENGDDETGCTVHIVDSGVDTGKILAQASVPILPGDTPDTLHARIQFEEHRLYPRVIGEYGAKLLAKESAIR